MKHLIGSHNYLNFCTQSKRATSMISRCLKVCSLVEILLFPPSLQLRELWHANQKAILLAIAAPYIPSSKHIICFSRITSRGNAMHLTMGFHSWLEVKWHDLGTRHPWIWIAPPCGLVFSDFTNDEFLCHYPILDIPGQTFYTIDSHIFQLFSLKSYEGLYPSLKILGINHCFFNLMTATYLSEMCFLTINHRIMKRKGYLWDVAPD